MISLQRKPATQYFLKRYVSHPRTKAIEEALLRCLKTAGHNPHGMALIGETGVGKTTLLERFRKTYRLEETDTHSYQLVVVVDTPPDATIKATLTALLRELGCPMPDKGTKESMMTRALTLLTELKTQLIVFDEFQHLLQTQTPKHRQSVIDFIKSLMNKTKIPVVLSGLPDASLVIQADPQLKRRFAAVQHIKEFSIYSEVEFNYYQAFLSNIQKAIPFPTLTLSDENMLYRIYLATQGKVGLLSSLLEQLIEQHDSSRQAVLKDFALAFERSMHTPNQSNPFTASMEQVRRKLNLAA